MGNSKRLTDKQEKFAQVYVETGGNAGEAVRQSYPNSAHWKACSIYTKGSTLLKNEKIARRIDELQAGKEDRHKVTVDRIVQELSRVAFGDMRDLMTWSEQGGVRLKDSNNLTDDAAACVAEISEIVNQNGGTIKLKKNDKMKALELLGRYLGMYKENVDVSNSDGSLQDMRKEAIAMMAAKHAKK